MMGSMGNALSLALGIAYSRRDLRVIVISGDGAALMSLGTLVLHKYLVKNHQLKNLEHFILDNNCYATTGGQTTASEVVDFSLIGPAKFTKVVKIKKEYSHPTQRVPLSPRQIKRRFKDAISPDSSLK